MSLWQKIVADGRGELTSHRGGWGRRRQAQLLCYLPGVFSQIMEALEFVHEEMMVFGFLGARE